MRFRTDLGMVRRLYPARLLCPWNSLGKNTGADCHFPPRIELGSPVLQEDSLQLTHQRSPRNMNEFIIRAMIKDLGEKEPL